MKKKILIVDDDPDLSRILHLQLKGQGYDTIQATNGKQAVEMAVTQEPDLILMDLMMPVMNGLEATRLIRHNPKSASVPIVIVTAKITLQNNEGYIQSGCNDFLSKPFTTKELGFCLDKLLKKSDS